MKLLSNLPTEKAMKELSSRRIGQGIQQVVETMALHKNDLVKAMRYINHRERFFLDSFHANKVADEAIHGFLKANPNYRVDLIITDEQGNDKKD